MALEEHMSSCPICRRRLEREAELRVLREAEEPSDAFGDVVYGCMASPLGTLWIASGPQGLLTISYGIEEASFCHGVERMGHGLPEYYPVAVAEVCRQIEEYFAGRRRMFDVRIDWSGFTEFQRAVVETVSSIPYGEVRSYGEVAEEAGYPRAARAVGTVMATNGFSVIVPCHRVVRRDGLPGEYGAGACGLSYKQGLLEMERQALLRDAEGTRGRMRRRGTAAGCF